MDQEKLDIKSEDDIRKMNFNELVVEIGNIKSYIDRAAGNDEQNQFGEYLGFLENECKKREIADAKREDEKSGIDKFSVSIQEYVDEIDNDDNKVISNGRIVFIKDEIEKYDINRNLYVLEERLKGLKNDVRKCGNSFCCSYANR